MHYYSGRSLVVPIASARATGPAFESLFFFLFLFRRKTNWKIQQNYLKVDFRKMWPAKPEKTVFLAFFDILVNMPVEGRFRAKNHIYVIFTLKVGGKIYMTH